MHIPFLWLNYIFNSNEMGKTFSFKVMLHKRKHTVEAYFSWQNDFPISLITGYYDMMFAVF